MGMAASQARYLALTARKSNVEFQGQQINQQRTLLAVEQGELFSELVSLENPIAPNPYDYEYDVYTFNSREASTGDEHSYRVKLSDIETDGTTSTLKEVSWTQDGVDYVVDNVIGEFIGGSTSTYSQLNITYGGDGDSAIQTGYVSSLAKGTWKDDEAYEQAMAKYNSDRTKYNKRVEEINQKTEKIQIQDRTLELKLRNLDTEQNAIQTELEAVKKVIDDTVKNVFTTFQSS